MERDAKIYVAGHTGLVGSAILRRLGKAGFANIVTRTSKDLDLRDCRAVDDYLRDERPEYVFLAAAKVGGILANDTYPADFIRDNLAIQTNVIHSAYKYGVKKLLFLGSSCIYPKMCPQPMKEEHLLAGALEPTNEPYAVAKIAGIIMCRSYNRQYGTNFVSVMPTNLYGPNDNYDLRNSHVLPALIRKFHEAKLSGGSSVAVWGSGKPRREFLHVDDLADACLFLMERYDGGDLVNIGTGQDLTINELAGLIKNVVGFEGGIEFDASKPDGTPRKLLDVSKLTALGWSPKIGLEEGVRQTYEAYVEALESSV
ncbi:MAG: GDP-L-fucose synthase [Candidatus Aquicultorales bacterium]